MKVKLLGLIVLLVCGFVAWWHMQPGSAQSTDTQADPPKPVKLTLLPGKILKQGSILTIRLATEQALLPGTVAKLGQKSSPLFEQSPGIYEALFGISVEMPPGAHTVVIQSPGEQAPLAQMPFRVVDGRFPRQNISVNRATKALKPVPGELETIQALKETVSPIRRWSHPFISPTPDCENSPFGVKRYHNGVYIHDYHKGVDLRAPHGRPVKAIADGMVKIATRQFRLHGGTVGLDHGQGVNSVFIHLSKVTVKTGDVVKKGDVIGSVGATGFATGPHLHWGLFVNGVPVNPDIWIPVTRCGS